MQFITSWERQGINTGLIQGRRDTLLELLQEKFGSIPESTAQHVQAISSIEELSQLLRRLIHANSIAEIGLDGQTRHETPIDRGRL